MTPKGDKPFWQEVLVFLGLGAIALGLGILFRPASPSVEVVSQKELPSKVVVDLQGAVVRPGVYELDSGARIKDLLVTASGLAQKADRAWVEKNLNQAAFLVDGAKIYIPFEGENLSEVKGVGNGLININQADQKTLETLSGVGPSLAQKIINYREAQGGFKSLEELMAVPGIGKKTFEELRDKITVF